MSFFCSSKIKAHESKTGPLTLSVLTFTNMPFVLNLCAMEKITWWNDSCENEFSVSASRSSDSNRSIHDRARKNKTLFDVVCLFWAWQHFGDPARIACWCRSSQRKTDVIEASRHCYCLMKYGVNWRILFCVSVQSKLSRNMTTSEVDKCFKESREELVSSHSQKWSSKQNMWVWNPRSLKEKRSLPCQGLFTLRLKKSSRKATARSNILKECWIFSQKCHYHFREQVVVWIKAKRQGKWKQNMKR